MTTAGRRVGLPRSWRLSTGAAGNAASVEVISSKLLAELAVAKTRASAVAARTAKIRSRPAAITDHRIRSPEQGVAVRIDGLARSIDRARSVEQGHHRLPQCLAA